MKKIISGILSVAMLCTSLCSFASPVQAAGSVNVKISKGQRMTYISETSTQYKVRLYTELATRCRRAPVAAQVRAMLPVFCGISGSISTMLSECSIYVNLFYVQIFIGNNEVSTFADCY